VPVWQAVRVTTHAWSYHAQDCLLGLARGARLSGDRFRGGTVYRHQRRPCHARKLAERGRVRRHGTGDSRLAGDSCRHVACLGHRIRHRLRDFGPGRASLRRRLAWRAPAQLHLGRRRQPREPRCRRHGDRRGRRRGADPRYAQPGESDRRRGDRRRPGQGRDARPVPQRLLRLQRRRGPLPVRWGRPRLPKRRRGIPPVGRAGGGRFRQRLRLAADGRSRHRAGLVGRPVPAIYLPSAQTCR
jgi:hypothetical protein